MLTPNNDVRFLLSRRAFIERTSLLVAASVAQSSIGAAQPASGEAQSVLILGDSRVHRTARAELALAFAENPFAARVVVGLAKEVRALGDSHRPPDLGAVSTRDDAYIVALSNRTLWVIGSTPRGMLQAVVALREAILARVTISDGFRLAGALQLRERIFHPRFSGWPGERADVRYIAQLGATHCLVANDWSGNRRSLQGYVTSPHFPNAVDAEEVKANHAGLRRLLDDCADFGLGANLWLTELPCQGGPWRPSAKREEFLSRFNPEVLSDSGTYEGQVLCFGHPKVRALYMDLLARFFADFPEIETIFVFGRDSGGEFCDPESCPRCRGMSLFAQRDRLLRFLCEEGSRVRPGLRVLTTGWMWDRDGAEFLERQAALPSNCGLYQAAQKDGWQCERQAHRFLKAARQACERRGQTFIGYDNLHWGDDSVHGIGDIQDFPLGIAAKLKRWHTLRADGVFDHWGGGGEDLSSNSIACREFFLNPTADPEAICRQIALRQFGDQAGELVFQAWRAIERAHVHLSGACTWAPEQWPMWYQSRERAPIPGQFPTEKLRSSQLAPREDEAIVYNPADFAEALCLVGYAWRRAAPEFAGAVRLLREAENLAENSPLFYSHWWNGDASTPTARAHIRRQSLYAESLGFAGREIGLQFELHALWERSGLDAHAYRRDAESLLKEDAAACRTAAAYFATLGKPKNWVAQYSAKARAIERYLSAE